MKHTGYSLLFSFIMTFVLFSAGCGEKIDQDVLDQERIERFLADNNLAAQKTASGLHYIIDTEGTGGNPSVTSNVTLYYSGYLLDGTVFDEVVSPANPVTFPLSNTIMGFQEGVQLFQKGGEGTIIIPSSLGYGSRAVGDIPENSVLVFDITVVDWQ